MIFYNGLGRKVEVNRLKWKVLNAQKIRNIVKKFDEINIIPFIDIMLVLLAIVLITASFYFSRKNSSQCAQSQFNGRIQIR